MENINKLPVWGVPETSTNEVPSDFNFSIGNKTSSLRDNVSVKKINQLTKDSFHLKYDHTFLRLVNEENIEYGYSNGLDIFISELIKVDPIITSQWLNDLYIKHFSNNKIIFAITVTISRIKNETIRPSLMIMAIASSKHKDIEVREAAIHAFENWSDLACLDTLKNITTESEVWLSDYIKQVISDLEKNLCQSM